MIYFYFSNTSPFLCSSWRIRIIKWMADQSTNTYSLLSFLISASISASSFSYPSLRLLSPVVSTSLIWVIFWQSRLISSHFRLSPPRISLISSSERHCLHSGGEYLSSLFLAWRFWIILYQFWMFSLMRCRYSGISPQVCFLSQSIESSSRFAVDRMFSIAFVTMKFLSDFRPRTGFSVCLGTGFFLWVQSQEKLRTRMGGVVPGGRVSLPMVPVCFLRKELGRGLRSSLRCPKVLPSPYSVCACRPSKNSPPKLAPCVFSTGTMGLEVVWLQKVDPVGLMPGGNFDLQSGSLAGGVYSLGIMLQIDYSISYYLLFIIWSSSWRCYTFQGGKNLEGRLIVRTDSSEQMGDGKEMVYGMGCIWKTGIYQCLLMVSLTAVVLSEWQSLPSPSLAPPLHSSDASSSATGSIITSRSWRVRSRQLPEGKEGMCCICRQCQIAASFAIICSVCSPLPFPPWGRSGAAWGQCFLMMASIFYLTRCQNFYHSSRLRARDAILLSRMRSYSASTHILCSCSLNTPSCCANSPACSFHFLPSPSSKCSLSVRSCNLYQYPCSLRCNYSNFNSHSFLPTASSSTRTLNSSTFPYKSAITACS